MISANRKKVLVAMSGGVDSSVAAALLKEQGQDVIGATMQVWSSSALRASEDKPSKRFGGCCGIAEINDAKRVADRLNIPHYTLNFRDVFKEKVIDNFVSEYKNGRTPNPCIKCNQYIKFDHLMVKAKELDCDYIATGHYARIESRKQKVEHRTQEYYLKKGADKRKDQAYVLYMMNQENLSHTLYPLGDLTKDGVRKIAKDLGLPVHDKDESQEICFIEDDDYGRFLKEVYPEAVKPGPILDREGNILGMHGGIAFYTLGQRKGIGSHQGLPKYVIQIDQEKNAIVIGDQKETFGNELIAEGVNYVSGEVPREPLKVSAKIRYNSPEAEAVLYPLENNNAKVVFKKTQRAITPGQSVVFYKGDEVIGGGIIS
ncbi:MAG: tRNA 2-thiouridine(34) synthase MnmA [Candidatus Margulisiibacteriota bacterium]